MGIINTHPSLLPRYRGPNPIAWTVRNGDREFGYSIHRMDAHFDTGPLLSQGTTPIDDVKDAPELFERMFTLLGSLLPDALARVEKGDPGDPQPDGQATYAEFFEPEYVEIDWSQTAAEVRRQVLAWRVAAARSGGHGALTTLRGERVRVLRVRVDDAEGGTRMDCADSRALDRRDRASIGTDGRPPKQGAARSRIGNRTASVAAIASDSMDATAVGGRRTL